MAWIILLIGGLFEVLWAFALRQSEGFTKFWPSVIAVVGIVISLGMLFWSMRTLPLGTAYMVWTGIGAVGAFAVGVMVLGEAPSATRIIAALLILSGLVLMKLASP